MSTHISARGERFYPRRRLYWISLGSCWIPWLYQQPPSHPSYLLTSEKSELINVWGRDPEDPKSSLLAPNQFVQLGRDNISWGSRRQLSTGSEMDQNLANEPWLVPNGQPQQPTT